MRRGPMQQNLTKLQLRFNPNTTNPTFFRKRNNPKPKRFISPLQQADNNPIYRALKVERETSSILDYILDTNNIHLPNPAKRTRACSQLNEEYCRLATPQPMLQKCRSTRAIANFKDKAARIVVGTSKVRQELQYSKKRIRILDRFNKRVDKYCSYLPDNPEEQEENQSNMANDQLIKLCNQDFFPTENLHKRATSLLNYREPKIPATKMRKLRERYRLNNYVGSSNSAPIQRLLTIHTVS